jgi:hypothetical protein
MKTLTKLAALTVLALVATTASSTAQAGVKFQFGQKQHNFQQHKFHNNFVHPKFHGHVNPHLFHNHHPHLHGHFQVVFVHGHKVVVFVTHAGHVIYPHQFKLYNLHH